MSYYEFRCVDCGASMVVDEGARRLVREEGCAVCGAIPSDGSFSPADHET